MRLTLIFPLLYLSSFLSAQQLFPIGKGWQLSVGIEIDQQNRLRNAPAIYVRAADTLMRSPFESSLSRIITSEVDLGNGPVTYYRELGYEETDRLAETLTRFITSLQFHHRTAKSLEYGFGLFYTAYRRNQRLAGSPELPEDFFVFQNESDVLFAGVNTSIAYNFLRRKRLQPYVGLSVDFGVNHSKYIRTYRQFPLLNIEQDLGATVVEQFRINIIFDFDLRPFGGVNYRLSRHLTLGINVSLRQGPTTISPGVQLRYLFKNASE